MSSIIVIIVIMTYQEILMQEGGQETGILTGVALCSGRIHCAYAVSEKFNLQYLCKSATRFNIVAPIFRNVSGRACS